MNVKRYFGKSTREALAQVKAELGADAIVLSNTAVAGGVEIVALPSDALGELHSSVRAARGAATSAAAPQSAPPPRPERAVFDEPPEDDFTVTLSRRLAEVARPTGNARKPEPARPQRPPAAAAPAPQQRAATTVRPFNPPRLEVEADDLSVVRGEPRGPRRADAPSSAPRPAPSPPPERRSAPSAAPRNGDTERVQALEATNARLMDELASIKGLLERQLAGFAWSELARSAPARTQLMSELLEAGFSAQLARELTEQVGGEASLVQARDSVRQQLNRGLRALANDDDIIERGGVYALVGPTGVGKTTTTAKLAARCVVRHGADKVALITTDGYRIGAHEQLRIYGRILGIQVLLVRDAADLRQTLQDLRNKHMVLIDTIGMSHRDRMVADQAALLTGAGYVRRLLLLNATSRGDTLDEVVRAYDGPDLAGCILSKVDEAASLAPAIDVAVRHELEVFYVANGQRVPEDLHLPNRTYLLHRALRELKGDSPHKLDADTAGMLMAAQAPHHSAQRPGARA